MVERSGDREPFAVAARVDARVEDVGRLVFGCVHFRQEGAEEGLRAAAAEVRNASWPRLSPS